MAEHAVPEQLIDLVVTDLVSRVAEFGAHRPENVDDALIVLRTLPEIEEGTELEIDWHSEQPTASATFNLTAQSLCLTVADDEGSREVYECDAGFCPRIDSDLEAWISYMRSLNCAEVAISCWKPAEAASDETPPPDRELKLAELYHENFHSCVTMILQPNDGLRMHVYDTGDAPTQVFGGDYDRWVDVPRHAIDTLLIALLKERYPATSMLLGTSEAFANKPV